DGIVKTDAAPKVVRDQRNILQAEHCNELFQSFGVRLTRILFPRRFIRKSKSEHVRSDTAERMLQIADDMPVRKRPLRCSVQEENYITAPLIHVVDFAFGNIQPLRSEGKQRRINPGRRSFHNKWPTAKIARADRHLQDALSDTDG